MSLLEKLLTEINSGRRLYKVDNYPMSIGELIGMYERNELIINPDFQRYFRWTVTQKTKFIESILLGIPVPTIFVYQNESGVWEVVDGLQRISTILEFFGQLRDFQDPKNILPPLKLNSTKYLPSLAGFSVSENEEISENDLILPLSVTLFIKRAKLNFFIIQPESDNQAKFEVFQRLNTGGSFLSKQELRNCYMIMSNKSIFEELEQMSRNNDFQESINLSEKLLDERYDLELVLKFITLVFFVYDSNLVLSENIDRVVDELLATDESLLMEIQSVFCSTFELIKEANSADSFKKFSDGKFSGKFLESSFEYVTYGVGSKLRRNQNVTAQEILNQMKNIWNVPEFNENIGSGSNAKQRIPKIIEIAKNQWGLNG